MQLLKTRFISWPIPTCKAYRYYHHRGPLATAWHRRPLAVVRQRRREAFSTECQVIKAVALEEETELISLRCWQHQLLLLQSTIYQKSCTEKSYHPVGIENSLIRQCNIHAITKNIIEISGLAWTLDELLTLSLLRLLRCVYKTYNFAKNLHEQKNWRVTNGAMPVYGGVCGWQPWAPKSKFRQSWVICFRFDPAIYSSTLI